MERSEPWQVSSQQSLSFLASLNVYLLSSLTEAWHNIDAPTAHQ